MDIKIDKDKKKLNKIPFSSGIYFFKDYKKNILYIGKATSLRDRVKSYFTKQLLKTRGELLVSAIEKTVYLDYIETDSVLEALILEARLINKYKPIYNIREKDNKSFSYICITEEDFPRIIVVRGRLLKENKYRYIYGPFVEASKLKELLNIIRKIFSFRTKCKIGSKRPCFETQIGLCPGVCYGCINKKTYTKIIKDINLFFENKKDNLIKKYIKEMNKLSKKQKFEEAVVIRNKIFTLRNINDINIINNKEDKSNDNFRIEGYDVSHLQGRSKVGVMIVYNFGDFQKKEYRTFNFKNKNISDTDSLKEILERRFKHDEWDFPKLIVIDGGKAQLNIAKNLLSKLGIKIQLVAVTKNKQHKPKTVIGDSKYKYTKEDSILKINLESHNFSIKKHRKMELKTFK